jgi:hypothetical protein
MQQVESNDQGGLDELNTKAALVNLELYRGALERCNETIRIYNGAHE